MDRNFNPNRKLTYEEKEKAIELKEQIILEQCGLCSKCHKPLTFPVEIAHRIPKANMYVKLYGWNIINHRYNLRATHKDCNSGVLLNPTTHPEEVYELITQIEKDLEGNNGIINN